MKNKKTKPMWDDYCLVVLAFIQNPKYVIGEWRKFKNKKQDK